MAYPAPRRPPSRSRVAYSASTANPPVTSATNMPGPLPPLPTSLAGVPSAASTSASASSSASSATMLAHQHRSSYGVLPAARSASDLPAYGTVPLLAPNPAYAYAVPAGAPAGYVVSAEQQARELYDAPPAAAAPALPTTAVTAAAVSAPPPLGYEYEYGYEYDPNLYYAPPSASTKRARYAPIPGSARHSVSSSSPQYLSRSTVLEEQQHPHTPVGYTSLARPHAHPARHRPSSAGSIHVAAPASTSTHAVQTPSHTTTPTAISGVPIPPSASKRQKTQRACDNCRRKRIRCDIIEPLKMCVHCRTYGLKCSFCLPISETRFKKKKEDEETADPAPTSSSNEPASGTYAAVAGPSTAEGMLFPPEKPSPVLTSDEAEDQRRTRTPSLPAAARQRASASESNVAAGDATVLGPTSIAYLVHSTPFVPTGAIEEHDRQAHQTFEVGARGDGVIRFHKAPKGKGAVYDESDGEDAYYPPAHKTEVDVVRRQLAGDVAEKLTNSYFAHLGTLFPIVTKSEFVYATPAPPALLYAICSVAAQSRDVPSEVRAVLRSEMSTLFKDGTMLTRSHTTTIRALLIMSMHHDVHGNFLHAPSRHWNRTGLGIRMAQDLGFHRESIHRGSTTSDAYHVEQRRRLWGACVMADRWASLYAGRPLSIDLTDCDVRLPSPVEVVRSKPGSSQPLPSSTAMAEGPHVFAFNTEMVKLSILFGRVLKTIYSPTGLMSATDAQIEGLLADIDAWRDNLPTELHYNDSDSNPGAGILQVTYACLLVLFFRVFMRISYVCPTHLGFSLTIERMTAMLDACKRACDWATEHPFYCDTLSCISYCLVSCATLLYHAYIRRKDQVALDKLRKVEQVYASAESDLQAPLTNANVSPKTKTTQANDVQSQVDAISVSTTASWRGKCGAVLKILLDAAQGAYPEESSGSVSSSDAEGKQARSAPLWDGILNPTAGVSNRKTVEMVASLQFRPDPTLPGGGVFITHTQAMVAKDLPGGTVIHQRRSQSPQPKDVPKQQDKKRKRSCQTEQADQQTTTASPALSTAAPVGEPTPEEPTPSFAQLVPHGAHGAYEWPINSTSLLQVLVQGQATDGTSAADGTMVHTAVPTSLRNGVHGAKVVTTLPVLPGGQLDTGIMGTPSQQPWFSAIESGEKQQPPTSTAPNLNPRLNDLIWSTPTPFVFEAPAGSPTPQTSSSTPHSAPATTHAPAFPPPQQQQQQPAKTHQPSNRPSPHAQVATVSGNLASQGQSSLLFPDIDPSLLDGLPQSLDFDAWSTWGARLPHARMSSQSVDISRLT